MDDALFRTRLENLLEGWRQSGMPGQDQLLRAADEIGRWRIEKNMAGLFDPPWRLMTATIDDAWGHGLRIIETFAQALGLIVQPLGLQQSAAQIIDRCRQAPPCILGITILQFDAVDEIAAIAKALPPVTRLIVGGPIAKAAPELLIDAGAALAAGSLTAFIAYLLACEP